MPWDRVERESGLGHFFCEVLGNYPGDDRRSGEIEVANQPKKFVFTSSGLFLPDDTRSTENMLAEVLSELRRLRAEVAWLTQKEEQRQRSGEGWPPKCAPKPAEMARRV